MGCLKLVICGSRKVLHVVKTDGKIIELKSAVFVKELLVNFQGFGVKPSRKSGKFLPPTFELQLGETYYLPVPAADGVSTASGGGEENKDRDNEEAAVGADEFINRLSHQLETKSLPNSRRK